MIVADRAGELNITPFITLLYPSHKGQEYFPGKHFINMLYLANNALLAKAEEFSS